MTTVLDETAVDASLARLVAWLEEWAPRLPRTALRYSIERFDAGERRRLMALR